MRYANNWYICNSVCKGIDMKHIARYISSVVVAAMASAMVVACGGPSREVAFQDDIDSLSYVIGMNLAYNIMEMDTTLRADKIVEGVRDVLAREPRMTLEEGKFFLLSYMNYSVYERVKKYENQYLDDLAASDKKIERTRTGLTYKVAELGDMGNTASHSRDTVAIIYTARTMAGQEVDPISERPDTLRTTLTKLMDGVQEGVRLVGQGGKITLWIPSSLAYGAAGDEQKGIKPNEMLEYEVEIVEVKRRRR